MQIVKGRYKRTCVWRKNKEKWKPRCLGVYSDKSIPVISAIFWGWVTFEGMGTLTTVDGIMNSKKYTEVLANPFWSATANFQTNKCCIL